MGSQGKPGFASQTALEYNTPRLLGLCIELPRLWVLYAMQLCHTGGGTFRHGTFDKHFAPSAAPSKP